MANHCYLCRRPLSAEGNHPVRDMLFADCGTCGRYFIDRPAASHPASLPDGTRYNLIAAVRGASDSGRILELTAGNLGELAATAPRWRTLMDGVDRLLVFLADRASRFLAPVQFNKDLDYPLLCARGEREMNELLVIADELGLFEILSQRITVAGWKRVDELRAHHPDSRQAFVAMWFDGSLDDAWLNGFKAGLERSRYFTAVRVDSVEHNQRIDDRIIAEIRRSGLVVADFTGSRGGVYFEAGFAQGLGIPVIWCCRHDFMDQLHFDTRQYNHIIWKSPAELADRLHERVSATLLPIGWGAV